MLNQIFLVGRLIRTPQLIHNENGERYTNITLAVDRPEKNETDFIDCILRDSLADNVCEYCFAGDLISVRGRLETIENKLQIKVEKVAFLQSNNKPNNLGEGEI